MVVLTLVLASLLWSCGGSESVTGGHALPDTLVVGTLYSPTGFFIMQGDTMGYDYDRICDFAKDKNIALQFKVAPSMTALIDSLEQECVDVLACEVPVTAEYRMRVISCGPLNETHQVLIQHTGDTLLTDVTQLVGREVWVEKASKYESRLRNLDDELGGGIDIRTLEGDTLSAEDLIDMVAHHKLRRTIVDSDIAQFDKSYYDSIDIDLAVSFPQRSAWAVGLHSDWLADSINTWSRSGNARAYSKSALKRYFEMSKRSQEEPASASASHGTSSPQPHTPKGALSPYDDIFRLYARGIGWDWRLIAAIAYTESGFNPHVVSWAGARGIMQLMPGTARAYGVSGDRIEDPRESVRAAVKYLGELEHMFRAKVPNPSERNKFVLAAYNAGVGHIYDAIALAEKYGKDPATWDGNVEETLLMKANPQYYNDPVCRSGFCRGRQTVTYVADVTAHYRRFQRVAK